MNWPMFPLEKVADVFGGSTPRRNRSEYWDGDIPWVTPTDLPMPGKDIADVWDTADHITAEGLQSCAARLLPEGTVLYSSRATIGKIGIARIPLATNQGFANFAPKPGVESKYLAYALHYFTLEISSLAGSTTFKEVRRGALKKYKVPLPSPSEQRRIVEILDEADALRKKRAEADEKAARILPALFYKMFGDPATNPRGWPTGAISKLANLQGGYAFKSKDFIRDGALLVRIGNLVHDTIFFDNKSAFLPKHYLREFERYVLLQGDLLIALTGATTGKLARYFCEVPALLNQRVGRFIPLKGKREILDYLDFLMRTDYAQNYIWQYARGFGQPNIAPRQIESLIIPIPPREIISKFSNLAQDILKNRTAQNTAVSKIETLFSVLLHRAFTGELTAKWREARMKEILSEMEDQAKVLEEAKTIKPTRGRRRKAVK